jgi:hypothetical protein
MMPWMRNGPWALLCLLVLQSAAGAVCRLPQPRRVCQEYFAEPVVVVAKLVRSRRVEPIHPGGVDGTYYSMEVTGRVKGRMLRRFQVYEENSSGRATFEWKRGETYLLFIRYSQEDRGWELDGCGNSGPMSSAKKTIDQLSWIKNSPAAQMIEGEIASEESLPDSVVVKVTGEGKTRTVPVENRRFRLRVEPGSYLVEPVQPGWQFHGDEFSYDDPQKIKVEAGQCAAIQFQAAPEKPAPPNPQ